MKIFVVQWELRHCVTRHCIVLLHFLMSVKRFIWPLDKVHNFFCLGGTTSRDRTMNSDANELQIGLPWLLVRYVRDSVVTWQPRVSPNQYCWTLTSVVIRLFRGNLPIIPELFFILSTTDYFLIVSGIIYASLYIARVQQLEFFGGQVPPCYFWGAISPPAPPVPLPLVNLSGWPRLEVLVFWAAYQVATRVKCESWKVMMGSQRRHFFYL